MSEPVVSVTGNAVWWYCPGCKTPHRVGIAGAQVAWEFNGSEDKPTFNPSVHTWRDYGDPPVRQNCHCFVRDGRIEFLSDCTHELVGQTVDMVSWEGWR